MQTVCIIKLEPGTWQCSVMRYKVVRLLAVRVVRGHRRPLAVTNWLARTASVTAAAVVGVDVGHNQECCKVEAWAGSTSVSGEMEQWRELDVLSC